MSTPSSVPFHSSYQTIQLLYYHVFQSNYIMSANSPEHDQLVQADTSVQDGYDPDIFSIEETLQAPSIKSYTTDEVHTMIHMAEIELDSHYKEDPMWSAKMQSKIIQSILQNMFIPPVLFSLHEDLETKTIIRRCIDGRQRLASIQKFMDGQIAYIHPRTNERWFYTVSKSQRNMKKEIPDKWREVFDKKTVTAVEFSNLTSDSERELFQRAQLSMPLSLQLEPQVAEDVGEM